MSNKSWKARAMRNQPAPVPKQVPTIREMHPEIARLERISEQYPGDVWGMRAARQTGGIA